MNKPTKPDGFRPVRPGGRGGKARAFPKGRQVDVRALEEIAQLMEGRPLRRDLLIEHLHVIQDIGVLSYLQSTDLSMHRE